MKKYHVYGIGNALVDYECLVNDNFLKDQNIEKGVMTLVDEEGEAKLSKILQENIDKRACGGSAANSIIAVSQFGGKSFYSCKVAGDETGEFYLKDLLTEGVHSNPQNNNDEGITGKCFVMVTEDAQRTMNTYLGITATIDESVIVEDELAQSHYLYIEGYLVASPTGKKAAIKARELANKNNVKTALTLSDPNMVKFFKDGLLEMIGEKVDLIFANEEEALLFTGKETVEEAKIELLKFANSAVITLGAKGALVCTDEAYEIPGIQVKALDTNGAGDLFAGSYLYGITHGMNEVEAGELAVKASAKLVTQYGPRLSKNQILEIKG